MRDSTNAVEEASLTNEIFPVTVPLTCGAKVILKVVLWPLAIVIGKEIPLTENPVPFHDAEETVTLEFFAVNFPVRVLLLPTATLPKLTVAGDTVSCADVVVVPVPLNPTLKLGLVASDVTAKVPVTEPLA